MNTATAIAYPRTTSVISPSEADRLEALEATIERGLHTFVEVGAALLEIRDSRLYRTTHGTFEDYCRERWGMSKTHANRMIDSAEVVSNLTPIGVIPATESQARPLTLLEPDEQREVWQQALESAPSGKVTAAHVQAVVDEYRKPEQPHVSYNSGNNEWYTPAEYIESARYVLGEIDLDPATTELANSIVKATTCYTVVEDGLRQPWQGRVWLNPPYASDLVGRFVDRLITHFRDGLVDSAIVLVNNATETRWFQAMAAEATAICFPQGRVRFWGPEGATGAPLQGQAILYFGPGKDEFYSEFCRYGFVGLL